jgi:hypothetical protein
MPSCKDKSVGQYIHIILKIIDVNTQTHICTHEKVIKEKLEPVQVTPRSLNDIKDAHEKRYEDLRRKRKGKRKKRRFAMNGATGITIDFSRFGKENKFDV